MKEKLDHRVVEGNWFVLWKEDKRPGKVIKICYSGLKVEFCDSQTQIINPNELIDLEDISEYNVKLKEYNEVQRQIAAEIERERLRDARRPKKICTHPSSVTEQTAKAAGCDIYETFCTVCRQSLRTSWSTAYDRDPDDLITDWNWWVQEYKRLYNEVPKRENYNIHEVSTVIYLDTEDGRR